MKRFLVLMMMLMIGYVRSGETQTRRVAQSCGLFPVDEFSVDCTPHFDDTTAILKVSVNGLPFRVPVPSRTSKGRVSAYDQTSDSPLRTRASSFHHVQLLPQAPATPLGALQKCCR